MREVKPTRDTKEIASPALEMQGRPGKEIHLQINAEVFAKAVSEAIHGKPGGD